MVNREYPHLYQPVKIRGAFYRNRICSAPNMLTRVVGGCVTPEYIDYLENKAMGGCAEVVFSELPVDAYGAHCKHVTMTWDNMALSAQIAAVIHQHGALACAELTHAGRLAVPAYNNGNLPIGPVSYVREDGVQVAGMDEAMMDACADAFAGAALYFKQAGFDSVMVHGGHNWLLSQFLSPFGNPRTDAYGGSPENRMRFPIMVLERVRRAVGPNFPIKFRVSGSDREDDGSGKPVEETIELLRKVGDYVDIVNVSAGMRFEAAQYAVPSTFFPHCTNAFLAAAIKKAGVPQYVEAVGAISTLEEAEALIASGKCDFVAMARGLIADPQLPNKGRTGMASEVRPCLRCSECQRTDETSQVITCAVNPVIGREGRVRATPAAKEKLNIVVVGGGPGGMEAAITAKARGHDVTLLEKSDSLGGTLKFTDCDVVKEDLRRYKDYMIAKTLRCGADVRLGAEATPALVGSLRPDAVLVATGSDIITPNIPGIENARHALDVYKPGVRLGNSVVIIGGGLVGCELAVHLGREGKKVTIIEMLPAYGGVCALMYRLGMDYFLRKYGVDIRLETVCKGIEKRAVHVEKGGAAETIPADDVVYCVGMRSHDAPFFALKDVCDTVIPIGDCKKVDKVGAAVQDAYFAVLDLA